MLRKIQTAFAGLVAAIGIVACAAGSANAQTISQPMGGSVYLQPGWGQSFTATTTGTVEKIAVRFRGVNTTTLRIYNGGVGSGSRGAPGVAAYTQTVTTTTSPDDHTEYTVFTLATPFPVIAGSQYSFVFDQASVSATNSNPYSGGVAISENGRLESGIDLAFQIYEVSSAAPVAVPTMTEWAMILLGVMLAGGAVIVIQRRRFAV